DCSCTSCDFLSSLNSALIGIRTSPGAQLTVTGSCGCSMSGGGNSTLGYFPRNISNSSPKCRTFQPEIGEKKHPNDVSTIGGVRRSIDDVSGRFSSPDCVRISPRPSPFILTLGT